MSTRSHQSRSPHRKHHHYQHHHQHHHQPTDHHHITCQHSSGGHPGHLSVPVTATYPHSGGLSPIALTTPISPVKVLSPVHVPVLQPTPVQVYHGPKVYPHELSILHQIMMNLQATHPHIISSPRYLMGELIPYLGPDRAHELVHAGVLAESPTSYTYVHQGQRLPGRVSTPLPSPNINQTFYRQVPPPNSDVH